MREAFHTYASFRPGLGATEGRNLSFLVNLLRSDPIVKGLGVWVCEL